MSIRPTVSGCNGPTEKLSNLADYILKKSLTTIPSYTRDTKDFINIIENTTLPQNCILLTIDVSSLYLNIPQEEGIRRTLDHFYTHFPDEDFPRASLQNCLRITLEHNIFTFAGKMYKQILGTAMGTRRQKTSPTLEQQPPARKKLKMQNEEAVEQVLLESSQLSSQDVEDWEDF